MNRVNLAAACGPLPGGGELASSSYHGNLILTVEGCLSFTDGMRWGIRVERPTVTASGRRGKPERILMLVANPGENVPDMLRAIAQMWDHGEVEIGKPYAVEEKI